MSTEDAEQETEPVNEQSEANADDEESETDTADEQSKTGADDESTEVAGGLDENIAGALTYLLGFITGIVFLFIEEENEFVRFHAAQSTVTFGVIFGINIVFMIINTVLAFIPVIGWIIAALFTLVQMLFGLATIALWLVLMFKAFQGDRWSLPVFGPFAERYV